MVSQRWKELQLWRILSGRHGQRHGEALSAGLLGAEQAGASEERAEDQSKAFEAQEGLESCLRAA